MMEETTKSVQIPPSCPSSHEHMNFSFVKHRGKRNEETRYLFAKNRVYRKVRQMRQGRPGEGGEAGGTGAGGGGGRMCGRGRK